MLLDPYDYVSKPIDASEVLVRIENHLAMHRLQQRLAVESEKLLVEIEARKRVEKELLQHQIHLEKLVAERTTEKVKTEQNYQMLFREMIDGFALHEIICDDNGKAVNYRFLAVNPAFERLTGLYGDTLIGKTVMEVMPQTESLWIERYGRVALTGEPEAFEAYSRELDRHYRVRAFRPAMNQFACIFVDITERKMNEDQMQEAQKMESIGNLAGGIAHDFNNILFPIIGLSEMLVEDLPPDSLEYENMRQILKAAERGSDLVQQILAFSRQYEHKMLPIRFQHILKEVLKLTRATIPANIEIVQDIQSDCGLIEADATQLHQVAMNLMTNACHAVEQTGENISVQLTEVMVDDAMEIGVNPAPYARLRISDTGVGIDPGLMDKIFEPYFTTKKKGKGTGLGLAVVYGIIREHAGDIQVHSEINVGATFDVYLPLMKKTFKQVSTAKTERLQGGAERILLVDDEEPIILLLEQVLKRLGYKVISFTSSLEALDFFRTDPHAFDLLVTDMAMPELTGEDLIENVLAVRSDIPIILCTGYSEQINHEKAKSIGVKGFLTKPIPKSLMARTVREVLDRP